MKVQRIQASLARRGESEYFIGEAFVQPLVSPEEGIDIVVVRFRAGARTYVHRHEAAQVLHCIEGRGVLATNGERHEIGPGDVVFIPAGEPHWHGAPLGEDFTHVSIRPPGGTTWTRTDPLAAT